MTAVQVGGLLDSKSYGVALAPGSPLRAEVSSAVIRLREDGVIARLKQKEPLAYHISIVSADQSVLF